jgi:hypothetical protein
VAPRRLDLAGHCPGGAPIVTIVFISRSAAQSNLQADWADYDADAIVRRCPVCLQESVVGHGRRQKQAHDKHHDWITVRRGHCNHCGTTITFLPVFSLPYTHYSLIARSEALRRYFVDGCCWEEAVPPLKDPDRVPDSSTLRRWFRELDSSHPPFTFLRRAIATVDHWIRSRAVFQPGESPMSWPVVFTFLRRYWPLRV